MEFIDHIVKNPNAYNYGKTLIEELKNSKYPNYLYGAGFLAFSYLALEKQDVKIAGVVVDKKYYKPEEKLGSHEVKPIEQLTVDNVGKVNLIVAFDESIDRVREKIPKSLPLNKIYHLDYDTVYNRDNLTYQYICDHLTDFNNVYAMCTDRISKMCFCNFINAKLTGNTEYLTKICTRDIYFPKEIIKLGENEIFVDCGAYNGNTIVQFIKETNGKYQKIYAFEPDERNIRMMKNTLDEYDTVNIEVYPYGVWDREETLRFRQPDDELAMNSSFVDTGYTPENEVDFTSLKVTSLDLTLNIKENVSYIKMDIEGSELKALEGAKHIIQRHRPRLAISAYHLKDDIYKIPLYLKSLNPDYKIYFRQHHYISTDLVCYAIP